MASAQPSAKGLIDRLLARVRGLPRQAILTLRNTFRRKGRVVLTQITLIMAGVVFVMVMSSAASFTYTINYLTDSLGLKVLMYFERPVRIDEAKAIIESQPDVEFAEFTLFQSSTAYKDKETTEGQGHLHQRRAARFASAQTARDARPLAAARRRTCRRHSPPT